MDINNIETTVKGLDAIARFSDEFKKDHPEMKEVCDDWIAIVLSAISIICEQKSRIEEYENRLNTGY